MKKALGQGFEMLTNVSIQNFRCLKSVNVPVRPLTILIGPNDSGKSTFLTALKYLADQSGFSDTDHWRLERNTPATILGRSARGNFAISSHPETLPQDSRTAPVGLAALFQLPSQGVSMHSSGQNDEAAP